uniref:Uncharacterized protein n=1 Tax=Rhizophora mucronata TaxID=61149 RepID=A0A2P2NN00_RHIMU
MLRLTKDVASVVPDVECGNLCLLNLSRDFGKVARISLHFHIRSIRRSVFTWIFFLTFKVLSKYLTFLCSLPNVVHWCHGLRDLLYGFYVATHY